MYMQVSQRADSRRRAQGTTIPEAVVAVAIIAVSLGAMMTLNGNQLRLVKVGRDTNSASLVVQERVEKLRTLAWPDLADSSHMAESYLDVQAKAAPILNEVTEKIVISPYPAGTATPMELQKDPGSATRIINSGSGLMDEKLVRVDLTLGWKGSDGLAHTRAVSTLLAKSGVNRNDVPAMGPIAGGPFDAFSPALPPLPIGGTPPVVPVVTPPGGGNGNGNNGGLGNGNGNVNGKPGKG